MAEEWGHSSAACAYPREGGPHVPARPLPHSGLYSDHILFATFLTCLACLVLWALRVREILCRGIFGAKLALCVCALELCWACPKRCLEDAKSASLARRFPQVLS